MNKFIILILLITASCYANIKTCFTPGQNCTQLIINQINAAQRSIEMQAYSFTSKPIANALISAHDRGISIFVLLDKSNIRSHNSVINALRSSHIPFLIDYKPAIAHNKIMIFDSATVLTGSFNFTASAQKRNAENLIIIDNKNLAQKYLANFNYRKIQSISLNNYCYQSGKC